MVLPPGKSATGRVVFNVAHDTKITAVTYRMNSDPRTNPQDGTGTWAIGRHLHACAGQHWLTSRRMASCRGWRVRSPWPSHPGSRTIRG